MHALQDAASLTQVDESAVAAGLPEVGADVPAGFEFLEKLRLWSQLLPPAASDQAELAALAPLGVTTAGESPYLAAGADTSAAFGDAFTAAEAALIAYLRKGGVPIVNGWQLPYHLFDYNVDFFEIGTIDTPLYTSIDPKEKYVLRAAAALGGLWGNHAYEAAYAQVYVDSDGEELNGENTYTLTFAPTPPANAFWSITMYSVPEFYLVANSIDRYSVGSSTEGLVYEEDGSLTIVMSAEEPSDPKARANWLPAPAATFRPLLRMYEPDASVIDGRYEIPAIQRQA